MSSSLKNKGITKPPNITHYSELDTDVVIWSNKDLPIDILSFIVWPLALFVLPLFCTWWLIQDFVSVLILVWPLPIFLAILIFRTCLWQETVVISDESITLSRTGFFAPKEKSFRKEDVIRISYERYADLDGRPSNYPLNIVYRYKLLNFLPYAQETAQLAQLVRKKEMYQLFLCLQTILERRGWPTFDEIQERSSQ